MEIRKSKLHRYWKLLFPNGIELKFKHHIKTVKMKKTILAALVLTISISAYSQSKSVEALFQKHKNNQEFFHLDIGGNFMSFANGMNIKLDNDHKELITNSMERLKMFKLPLNGTSAQLEFRALKKGLEREKFDLMMEVSEKSNSVMIYTQGNNRIKDIVLLVNDKKGEFLVIELQGDFDSKTLADAGKNFK